MHLRQFNVATEKIKGITGSKINPEEVLVKQAGQSQ